MADHLHNATAARLASDDVQRDDALSYEHDYRDRQGPIEIKAATSDETWHDAFVAGFCPRCLSRLSWNRTSCFDDEREDQCAERLIAWYVDESEALHG